MINKNLPSMKSWFLLLLIFIFTLGFRIYPNGNRWNISASDPKLWLEFCETPNIGTNDIPASDPLYGQTITFNLAIDSIISDYNNLGTSFITLADATRDPEYNASLAAQRTIQVCFENVTGMAGGIAQQILDKSQKVIGCQIKIAPKELGSAKSFVAVLTHEIGHCLGLDHPQESVHAIMSYFTNTSVFRLEKDDKMGLTYLYPQNPEETKEEATFGLSCGS